MKIRIAVVVGVALIAGMTSRAQENRLGDVAGGIKLNPEAIVETSGTVEDPRAAAKADEDLFDAVLTECSTVADQLGRLVGDARTTVLYPGDDLLIRIEESSLELDRQLQDIFLLRLAPKYAEPVDTARIAADLCAAADLSVRREIEIGSVSFNQAIESVARCRERLGDARAQFALVAQSPGAGGAPSGVSTSGTVEQAAPPTDDEIIEAFCEPQKATGPEAFEACQGVQYRALAALESRDADNEMLPETVFSDIRRICSELEPKNFSARDICEQDRMMAARLELE
jgi:hypothetical protein